jgi:hypothetical protein
VAAGAYAALYRLGQTWGATAQEQRQPLAGDELLPEATALTTHAITIAAPAQAVWPWLVQMGWGRAGWYTYRWVDRLLFPANGPSATQLLAEHQRLAVGDHILDGPAAADCWFTVERLEPQRLLVVRSTRHLPASWRQRGLSMDWIWSWHLREPAPGCTRVVQRNRMRLRPVWFERAFLATIVPADFIMARNHLGRATAPLNDGSCRRSAWGRHQPDAKPEQPSPIPAESPVTGARGRPAWLQPPRGAAWTPAHAARARVKGRRRRSRRDATRP